MAIHDEKAETLLKRLEMKSSWVRRSLSVLRVKLESLLAYGRRLAHYTQQARKSDETQEAEKSQSNVPDDDSNLTPLHPPKSKNYGMPDEAEKSQSNVPDDESNLTPLHPLKYRKRGAPDKAEEIGASFSFLRYRMAALGLSLLTFTAGMCPVSGTMCDVQAMAVSKGEVAIACPLTADVRQTKHSVLIKYFKPSAFPEDVLECDWKSSQMRFHCLHTQFRAELTAIHPDRVLARLPKDRLGNGTYRCQLVPPDPEPFTDCDICDPDDAKDVPTTEAAPETLPTTLDHFEGMKEKPQISVHGEGGQHGGLVAAVIILSIIVFCLLLAMATMVVFFLRYIGMIPGRKQNRRRRPVEAEARLRDLHETLHA